MSRIRVLGLASLFLWPAITAGCSSVPAEVREAEKLGILFWSTPPGNHLVLVNPIAYVTAPWAIDRPRKVVVKHAADDVVMGLVEFAAGRGFFDEARLREGSPKPLGNDSPSRIVIRADDRWYTLMCPEYPYNDVEAEFWVIAVEISNVFGRLHQFEYAERSSVEFLHDADGRLP